MKQAFMLPANLRRDRVIQRIAQFLAALPKDKAFRLELEEHKARRTNQQNRYLFGVVYPALLAHLDGWEAEDIHEYMLGECFGWETLQGFGRRRLRPMRRSSRMNKQEFSDFVAFIQRKAADMGVFIPDPDQDYDLVKAA